MVKNHNMLTNTQLLLCNHIGEYIGELKIQLLFPSPVRAFSRNRNISEQETSLLQFRVSWIPACAGMTIKKQDFQGRDSGACRMRRTGCMCKTMKGFSPSLDPSHQGRDIVIINSPIIVFTDSIPLSVMPSLVGHPPFDKLRVTVVW